MLSKRYSFSQIVPIPTSTLAKEVVSIRWGAKIRIPGTCAENIPDEPDVGNATEGSLRMPAIFGDCTCHYKFSSLSMELPALLIINALYRSFLL